MEKLKTEILRLDGNSLSLLMYYHTSPHDASGLDMFVGIGFRLILVKIRNCFIDQILRGIGLHIFFPVNG